MNKDKEVPETELTRITDRIDTISKERPSHKEPLVFLKWVIKEKFRVKPKIHVDSIDIDGALLEVKQKEGFPLVNKKDLRLDISAANSLFEKLCKLIKKKENASEDIDRIIKAKDDGELNLKELFEKAAAEDYQYMISISDRLKVQGNLLPFLAENSLQPIFEAYTEQLKDYVDQEKWWRGYCPICGSKPVMAELVGAERKKFLICSCCTYAWRFMRTKCPFCENEESEAFKYFFTEKEGRAYRIETCQKCKRYIKTVDTEELGEDIIPPVEDIGTLYLDVLAKQEGYAREVYTLGLNLGGI